MSIKAVFRVQCSGPCGGWLSRNGEVIRVNPLSRDVDLWPGERAARTAAQRSGWWAVAGHPDVYCPECRINPLGIRLPPGPVCVCTHPAWVHNDNGLCIALPGVLGCGCLGFLEAEE